MKHTVNEIYNENPYSREWKSSERKKNKNLNKIRFIKSKKSKKIYE